eukprot:5960428-Pyramimonas_sp.AAC.1
MVACGVAALCILNLLTSTSRVALLGPRGGPGTLGLSGPQEGAQGGLENVVRLDPRWGPGAPLAF